MNTNAPARRQGIHATEEMRAHGRKLAKRGKTAAEIAKAVGVSDVTARRWILDVGAAAKPKTIAAKSVKRRVRNPMDAITDQLMQIGELIKAQMPDLTQFSMRQAKDGKTEIAYAVRQVSEATGAFKL